jgi:hypothetical protein
MAYVSQELKAKLAPKIKAILKKYGVKASIAVRHHSTLVVNIKSGPIDFIGSYNKAAKDKYRGNLDFTPAKDSLQVNEYWYKEHFDSKALKFLSELLPAMNEGNFDNSDPQTDYFHVGWYVTINVGKWDKPYALVK